jgi:hypothetical protein
MSPPPAPIDPESIPKELKDGVVAGTIGAMSMAARLLLSEEKHTWSWVARRVCAASLTAAIAGYALTDYISSPGLRMGAIGALSYSSPEALDALLRWVKNRAEREVEKVSKPAKSKPNAKAKRPTKRK